MPWDHYLEECKAVFLQFGQGYTIVLKADVNSTNRDTLEQLCVSSKVPTFISPYSRHSIFAFLQLPTSTSPEYGKKKKSKTNKEI